jgi:sterol desaturase/sphingolipid hydroxylase (fatty acid hydroxylase superfamily)
MLHALFASLDNLVSIAQTALYIDVIQPLMYWAGWMDYDEDTYDALYWVIVGVLEVVAMYAVLRPLEAWRPVEQWPHRKAVRADIIYTWIVKLGILNLLFFFLFQPGFDAVQGWLRLKNVASMELDNLWPGVTDQPLVTFVIYLVVLDFAGYWYHRWQHRFGIWWELHAVHHSQQQMSLWTDDRNHILDDVLQAAFFAGISLLIGVPPSQFVVLVAVTNLAQSIQHVNARLDYGRWLDKLFVSPIFHRRHHAIGYGHEGTHYGCNFGVLLPWWDIMFRTASWNRTVEPTGIRDQLAGPDGAGVSYGMGFWAQQWLALPRIAKRLRAARANPKADGAPPGRTSSRS